MSVQENACLKFSFFSCRIWIMLNSLCSLKQEAALLQMTLSPVSRSPISGRAEYTWGVCKAATLVSGRWRTHLCLKWRGKNKPTVIIRTLHKIDVSILSAEARQIHSTPLASFVLHTWHTVSFSWLLTSPFRALKVLKLTRKINSYSPNIVLTHTAV